jgi:hypothetical protein
MTKKYEVCIEYGPTAADVHYVTVDADSIEDALAQGTVWAEDNRIRNAMVSNATELSDTTDDFTDIIEWTPEEEEEFVRLFDNTGDE